MKPSIRAVPVSLAGLLLLALATPLEAAAPVPQVSTLENGVRVVLLEDHAAPRVAAGVWIHVGGKDETEPVAGFSLYLSRLIPQGTRDRSPRQQQLEIFRVGGASMVQSDYDRTYFLVQGASDTQDRLLEALAQQITEPSLLDTGVDRIRPALTQELTEAYAVPRRVLFFEQMRTAFPGQPYRFPYYGSFKSLAAFEHVSAESFYGNFYVANNLVVAVAGDLQPGRTLSKIKSLFGKLKPSKTLPAKPAFPPGFTGSRLVVKNVGRLDPSVSFLFPTPGYRHPDRYALAVLARILNDPRISPLLREVAGPARTVHTLSVQFHLLEERGLLAISAFPDSAGSALDAVRTLAAALRKLREEGIGEEVVRRAAREERLAAAVRRDSLGHLTEELAESVLFGEVRYAWDLEANLGAVSAGDVRRVLSAYLVAENARTLVILPEKERSPSAEDQTAMGDAVTAIGPPKESTPTPDFARTRYAAGKAGALTPRGEQKPPPPALRTRLENGLAVVLKPRRGRGLTSVALLVRAGYAFDPEGGEGTAQMVASSLTLGSRLIPAAEYRRRLEALGSTFGITTSVETVEAGLTVFSEDLPEALALLAAPVKEPAFPEDQLMAARERIERFAEARSASPGETARDLARERIYRGHPYGRPFAGSETTLAALKREQLVEFHRRTYRPDRAVLSLAGDFDPAAVRQQIATAFGSWSPAPGEKGPEIPEVSVPEESAGEFSRVVDAVPAEMILAFPGVSLKSPDFPMVRALATLLSARGFLDLVMDRPLALSVRGVPEGYSRGGMLSVEASVPPADVDRMAYEVLLRIRALGVKEVTPETVADLARIERGRLLREKESLYTMASNLGFYELLGPGAAVYDEGTTFPPELTPARLREAAARFLDPGRLVRISAGPVAR